MAERQRESGDTFRIVTWRPQRPCCVILMIHSPKMMRNTSRHHIPQSSADVDDAIASRAVDRLRGAARSVEDGGGESQAAGAAAPQGSGVRVDPETKG